MGADIAEAAALHVAMDYAARLDVTLPPHTPVMPHEMCYEMRALVEKAGYLAMTWDLIRRKGRDAFDQVVRVGRQRLDEGRWPLLFPEGTRVAPGKMGRFKSGGAMLAVRTEAPVIPIALNSGECWRRNAFIKRPGLITVSIGPAIESKGLSPDELNAKVQAWIDGEMRALNPERYGPT